MKRAVSAVLTLVFLSQNVLLTYAIEDNIWKQRRHALDQAARSESSLDARTATRLAGLPQPSLQAILPRVSAGLEQIPTGVSFASGASGLGRSASLESGEAPEWLKSLVGAYGNVQEIRLPQGGDVQGYVVHIQDVHEAYEAQINMAHLIEQLVSGAENSRGAAGSVVVGVEGASGPFDLKPYRRFAAGSVVKSVADAMVKQGLMSGAEFFGVTGPETASLWGVEDKDAYTENVRAFKASLGTQKADDSALADVESALTRRKGTVYTAELRELDEKMSRFDRHDLGLGLYVRYLAGRADGRMLGSNTKLLLQALALEEKLDFKQVETERVRLIETLVENLAQADLEHLLRTSLTYRLGRTSYRDYYEYLRNVCSSHSVQIQSFGQLDDYIRYVLTAERIQREKLLDEVASLEGSVLAKYAVRPEQKRLIEVGKDLQLVAKLNAFSLTHEEWGLYAERRAEIARLSARLAEAGVAGGIDIAGLLERHEAFYRAAQKRNDVMVDNLLRKAGETKGAGAPVAILVAGGFHSPGMRDILLARHVAYISLTPRLTKVDEIPHYLDPFTAERTSLDKLFAGERLFLKKPLMGAVSVLLDSSPDQFKFQGFFAGAAVIESLGALLREQLGDSLRPGQAVSLDDFNEGLREEVRRLAAEEESAGATLGAIKGLRIDLDKLRVTAGDRPGVLSVTVPVALQRASGESGRGKDVTFQVSLVNLPTKEQSSSGLAFETDAGTVVFASATPGLGERLVGALEQAGSFVANAGAELAGMVPGSEGEFQGRTTKTIPEPPLHDPQSVLDRALEATARGYRAARAKIGEMLSGFYAEDLDKFDKVLTMRMLSEKAGAKLERMQEIRSLVFQRGDELASRRMATIDVATQGTKIEQVQANLERWRDWALMYAEQFAAARPEEAAKLGGLEGIKREINEDIYGPLLDAVRRIGELEAAGEISPDAVHLQLSEVGQPARIDLERAARVGFLPMKGDPWQVGHIFVMLEAMASQKLDKVIIGIDNGDPRKPNLSSLTVREGITRELLKILDPLVEYSPVAKEEADLFEADGETMIFRLMKWNRGAKVEWNYMVGSDHRPWEKPGKDGAPGKADTAQKLVNHRKALRDDYAGEHLGIIFIERAGEEFAAGELEALIAKTGEEGYPTNITKIRQPMDTSSTRVRKEKHWWTVPMDVYEMADAARYWGAGDDGDPFRPRTSVKPEDLLSRALEATARGYRAARAKIGEMLSGFYAEDLDKFDKVLTMRMLSEKAGAKLERMQEIRSLVFQRGDELASRRMATIDVATQGTKIEQVQANLERWRDWALMYAEQFAAARPEEAAKLGGLEGIKREINEDIYGPLLDAVRRIGELEAAGEISPDAVHLQLSEVGQPARIDLERAARVGFLPMKGDPWQVGHIFVMLEAMASQKLDKVIIGIDNGDPRKPNLSSLTVREGITRELLKILDPLVEYSPVAKEEADLFEADGETMIFRLMKWNRGAKVEWNYMVGSDHRPWEKPGKDGAPGKADTAQKLVNHRKALRDDYAGEHLGIIFIERAGEEFAPGELEALIAKTGEEGYPTNITKIRQPMDTSSTRVRKEKHWWTVPMDVYEMADAARYWGAGDENDPFLAKPRVHGAWHVGDLAQLLAARGAALANDLNHVTAYASSFGGWKLLEPYLPSLAALASAVVNRAKKETLFFQLAALPLEVQMQFLHSAAIHEENLREWGDRRAKLEGALKTAGAELTPVPGESNATAVTYIVRFGGQERKVRFLLSYVPSFLQQKGLHALATIRGPTEDEPFEVSIQTVAFDLDLFSPVSVLPLVLKHELKEMQLALAGADLGEAHEKAMVAEDREAVEAAVDAYLALREGTVKAGAASGFVVHEDDDNYYVAVAKHSLNADWTEFDRRGTLSQGTLPVTLPSGAVVTAEVLSWGDKVLVNPGTSPRRPADAAILRLPKSAVSETLRVLKPAVGPTDAGTPLVMRSGKRGAPAAARAAGTAPVAGTNGAETHLLAEVAVEPGDSGSPLFNPATGELVGLLSSALGENNEGPATFVQAATIARQIREYAQAASKYYQGGAHHADDVLARGLSPAALRPVLSGHGKPFFWKYKEKFVTPAAFPMPKGRTAGLKGLRDDIRYLLSKVDEEKGEWALFYHAYESRWGSHVLDAANRLAGEIVGAKDVQLYLYDLALRMEDAKRSPSREQREVILLHRELLGFLDRLIERAEGAEAPARPSALKRALKKAADLARKFKPSGKTFLEEAAPALKDYTMVSLQMEAGLDRGLIDQIAAEYGEEMADFVAQLTMTGGLGALMHDLQVGWKKNGANVIGIHPLYNDRIKGVVEGMPKLKQGQMGDMIRSALEKSDSFTITLDDSEFKDGAVNEKSKAVIGKTIHVEVYKGETKFGKAPLYYLDAYYMDGEQKVRIFDELYPDNDYRAVHMAVYNEAAQALLQRLLKPKSKVLFVENEVFVSLPKNKFPNAVRHHINHTVWKPGMYRPPAYAFKMLGFDEAERPYIEHDGQIDIAEYAGAYGADVISGVALYEHDAVLREQVLRLFQHKIVGYNKDGLRNTNGALADQWQGEGLRALIDAFKDRFGIDRRDEDRTLFESLGEPENGDAREEFKADFEKLKAGDVLALLLWMARWQNQSMGGGGWLRERLAKAGLEAEYGALLARAQSAQGKDAIWDELKGKLEAKLSSAGWREALLEVPMASNVRRQVIYKGPDKYEEMFELFANPQALDGFRKSGARLIIGGRTFDKTSRALFDKLKQRARELGLEDRIAFVENYNIYRAPTIFRGVAATVMLSDEFLEASATSMMKAVLNGGALIGVWGGAMPELFKIVESETGEEIDVFRSGITHDELVDGLTSGRYKITNGFLVSYSDADVERSSQDIGWRRPSVYSLIGALAKLGQAYSSGASRRDLMFDVLANAAKVDIERSQARAHIMMWADAVKNREAKKQFFDSLPFTRAKARQLLFLQGAEFPWKRKIDVGRAETVEADPGSRGLKGLMDAFRRVRASGDEGIWSLEYHAWAGDIFEYIQKTLAGVEGMEEAVERVKFYAAAAKSAPTGAERLRYTTEALQFVDDLTSYLATRYPSLKEPAKAKPETGKGWWWRDRSQTRVTVAIPIYALRREQGDPGIGKFSDLPAAFAQERLKIKRVSTALLLPHTASLDESPYSAVSSFAVNELYVDWSLVPEVRVPQRVVSDATDRDEINYTTVRSREHTAALKAWRVFQRTELAKESDRAESFLQFLQSNRDWLEDYARFMAITELQGKSPVQLGWAWDGPEVEAIEKTREFRELVNMHRYAQWIGYGQLKDAVTQIQRWGGTVMFDMPMFRGKNSVDLWRHPQYFREHAINNPSVRNPGVINQYTYESWGDLSLWNWSKLAEEHYGFILRPVRHWLEFGMNGMRADALHFAYDFGDGQLASGDEKGDAYVAALAQALHQYDAAPLAEAFNGKGEAVAQQGFVAVERNWKRVNTHDDPRKFAAGGIRQAINNAAADNFYPDNSAKFITYTLGDEDGEYVPVKTVAVKGGEIQSRWTFRMPAADRSLWRAPRAVRTVLETAANNFVKRFGDVVEIWASSVDWFQQQWGRDAFISLPGLLLSTGRFDEAKAVMRNFAKFERNGLIPNRIHSAEHIEYNNVDGSLWFIHAVKEYGAKTGDAAFLEEMRPVVARIIAAYRAGTGYERWGRMNQIYMDKADGLIVSPRQATWMDADPKGDDHPVTPRDGKAVEINALWYEGLRFLAELERGAGAADAAEFDRLADRVKESFNEKFWFETEGNRRAWGGKGGALYDVIGASADKPYYHQGAIRPNMLIAVSHAGDLLSPERREQVVRAATVDLLTDRGLRTLSPRDSHYIGRYHTEWEPQDKDQAYHQGTVWPWLIGPYVDALVRVMRDQGKGEAEIRAKVRGVLDPLIKYTLSNPMLTLPEVFDGDAPRNPGGTRSQAWSVAEVLRVFDEYAVEKPAPKSAVTRIVETVSGAWHVGAIADLLSKQVLPALASGTLGMTTFGLSLLPGGLDRLRAALNGGEDAWRDYLRGIDGLPYSVRMRLLHEAATSDAHRMKLERLHLNFIRSAVLQADVRFSNREVTDDFLLIDAMRSDGKTVPVRFRMSNAPALSERPDLHALATISRGDDGVYEVALQRQIFVADVDGVFFDVIAHEIHEVLAMSRGLAPEAAHRESSARQGAHVPQRVINALQRIARSRDMAALNDLVRRAPEAKRVNVTATLPDIVPMPLTEPGALANMKLRRTLGAAEGAIADLNLLEFFDDPGTAELVDPAVIERGLRKLEREPAVRGIAFGTPEERAEVARQLAALNLALRTETLDALAGVPDDLKRAGLDAESARRAQDALATFVLKTVVEAGREDGQKSVVRGEGAEGLRAALSERFAPVLRSLLAVASHAGVEASDELVRSLANVYAQAFLQGVRRTQPVSEDEGSFPGPTVKGGEGVHVGVFHFTGNDFKDANNSQTMSKLAQMVEYYVAAAEPGQTEKALDKFGLQVLMDTEGRVDEASVRAAVRAAIEKALPSLSAAEVGTVVKRVAVTKSVGALVGAQIDLDTIFVRIQEQFGSKTVKEVSVFTPTPSRFREAWRAQMAWVLYMVMPNGLMTEASRSIEEGLQAIRYLKTQA